MHFIVFNASILYFLLLGNEIASAYDNHKWFEYFSFKFSKSNVHNTANNPKTPSNTALELSMSIDSNQIESSACCQLVKRLVSLRHPKDAENTKREYSPYCKPVNRCDGFCQSVLRKCEPTKTRNLNYTVTVVEQYSKNTTRNHTEIVSIVEHENCECRCRVKKENCTSKQVYDEKQCKCYCNNATDDDSCNKGPRTKWDAKTCSCVCPKVEDCVTAFDYNTCKCEPQVAAKYGLSNVFHIPHRRTSKTIRNQAK